MMLSSTIRTLMGGTAPSRRPAGSFGTVLAVFLVLLKALFGRGEATRSGFAAWSTRGWPSAGICGLGRGGGAGTLAGWAL